MARLKKAYFYSFIAIKKDHKKGILPTVLYHDQHLIHKEDTYVIQVAADVAYLFMKIST
jgi:hypothetical protein